MIAGKFASGAEQIEVTRCRVCKPGSWISRRWYTGCAGLTADRGRSRENEGEGHMTNKTTDAPFNVLDYLTTSAMIDAYVAEAYASGDSEYIAEALETAAIARDRIKTAPLPTSDGG